MSKGERSKKKGRANGFGTLERRPGGGFLARWIHNGKRYSQTIRDEDGEKVTDRRTAERILKDITEPFRLKTQAETVNNLADKASGLMDEVKKWQDAQPALAITQAFEAYRASTIRPRRAGDGSLTGYESFYGNLVNWLTSHRPDYKELRQVTQADADAFTADFTKTHTGGTFNKHLIFFRCLWRVLMQGDKRKGEDTKPGELPKAKLACNPWEDIKKMEHSPHRHRELTTDELLKVCGAVEGELRTLFAIGIYTGLRLGDCCRLTWGEADLARGILNHTPHKTKKHGTVVTIPIHRALAAILLETPPTKRTGYIMPGIAESYSHDKSAVSKDVQRVFENCGISTNSDSDVKDGRAQVDVGFHSLRHTFVSLCGNAGASLALVQSMVGHTSKEMTQHYFHENDDAKRDAVNLLPDVIDTKSAIMDATDGGKADASGNLAAFRELIGRMSADERAEAAKELAAAGRLGKGVQA